MTTLAIMEHVEGLNNSKATLHDELAGVYLTLTRPLTEEARTQALSILNDAMASLRRMDDPLAFIKIEAAGLSKDIDAVIESMQRLKT